MGLSERNALIIMARRLKLDDHLRWTDEQVALLKRTYTEPHASNSVVCRIRRTLARAMKEYEEQAEESARLQKDVRTILGLNKTQNPKTVNEDVAKARKERLNALHNELDALHHERAGVRVRIGENMTALTQVVVREGA